MTTNPTRYVSPLLCLVLLVGAAIADEASPANVAVIHLGNGSHVIGKLIDSGDASHLRWQSPAFVKPFEFAQTQLNAVHFPLPTKLTQADGEYCFELAGGDVVFGTLVALTPDEIVVEAAGIGQLHCSRSLLRRMYRWKGGSELIYFGPSGLAGWTVSSGTKAWTEEAGQLLSAQEGAVIRRDFHAPTMARFEFELSWKEKSDFELALGVGDAKSALRSFRFEVWANEIVAMRETETAADVTNLQTIKSGAGRIQLQAFLDQQKGRLLVFSSSGTPLADMTVTTSKPHQFGGIQLTNKSGDIRLERLCISRWNGETPQAVDLDKSRIHKSDGSIVYGQLKSFDGKEHQFVVDAAGEQQHVAQDQLQDVFFSQQPEVPARSITAVFLNDQRLSGNLLKVENNVVWLKSAAIQEPIKAPIESLRTLLGVSLNRADKLPKENSSKQRTGRLEVPGTVLQGNLVDSPVDNLKTLCWQPIHSSTASSLQPGVSGRIVYRDAPTPPPAQAQAQARAIAMQNRVAREASDQPNATPPKGKQKKPILHLRSGDMIPCDQATIDENGVTFSSPMTDATFIRNDQIKVLELVPDIASVEITKQKKDRLLMLPRMQRDNPPTQLIRSVDGDYLKGRLLSMDEQQMQVEIRLETKTLQRDRIARIIWLHADELDANAKRTPVDQGIEGTRIQVLTDNPQDSAISKSTTGATAVQKVAASSPNRLTFVAQQMEGSILSGRSELLGACRVDLTKIDRILIENVIEEDAALLAFHQWKLHSAADPVAAREGGAADGGEGQESALVGKVAPEIELETLAGGKFKLSDRRDKIIVLDFWASWCGPCLQAMPQVDKVAHEFADRGVELMAINLEEKEDRIKAALERLKLETPVALDRDGRIAEKYGATAIPQTVIIDRQGKVARLFVGGGPRFGDQLRAAIEAVLSGKNEMPE